MELIIGKAITMIFPMISMIKHLKLKAFRKEKSYRMFLLGLKAFEQNRESFCMC